MVIQVGGRTKSIKGFEIRCFNEQNSEMVIEARGREQQRWELRGGEKALGEAQCSEL